MTIKEIQLTLTPEEFHLLYILLNPIPNYSAVGIEYLPILEKMVEIKKRIDYVADRSGDN